MYDIEFHLIWMKKIFYFVNEFKNTFKVYLYMIRLIDVSCDKCQT
jgi:hypothetical protein